MNKSAVEIQDKKTKKQKHNSQAGFTLMELLVVVVILGLLATLVGPKLFGTLGKAKGQVAKTQIELLAGALDRYRLDMGSYPTTDQGLKALSENPGNSSWGGPYLKKAVPKDPWGQEYQYRSPGDHGDYDLWSLGKDAKLGGEGEDADILSWK